MTKSCLVASTRRSRLLVSTPCMAISYRATQKVTATNNLVDFHTKCLTRNHEILLAKDDLAWEVTSGLDDLAAADFVLGSPSDSSPEKVVVGEDLGTEGEAVVGLEGDLSRGSPSCAMEIEASSF